jgi:hypothetical protein
VVPDNWNDGKRNRRIDWAGYLKRYTDGIKGNKMEFALNHEEAIVLFDFLSRLEYDATLKIEHLAEEAVLSKIHGQMETKLVEPFQENWKQILNDARQKISLENGLVE